MTRMLLLLSVIGGVSGFATAASADDRAVGREDGALSLRLAVLRTNEPVIDYAYRIAIGDLMGNVMPFQGGLLDGPAVVMLAGMDYGRPWTRDASINAWNGGSLLMPEVARNTLLSVLARHDDGVRIGGQYWDAIVWTSGAWHHYLCTGDWAFLAVAADATRNSLVHYEKTEFDATTGLFRGPGWSDGVAAYPGVYGDCGGSSSILAWPKHHPDKVAKPGYGIPMQALSTNCLYYNGYRTLEKMARALGEPVDPTWSTKAAKLKDAINQHLWLEEKGHYRFLVGPFGPCDHQEGLGHAYALLFGVASGDQAASIFRNSHVTPAGVPCGWPNLPRYDRPDGRSFGRHMGTVWPQIQGFWAAAAARYGKIDVFAHELFVLARHAARDKQFAEIYHPLTGGIYGGLQEAGERGIVSWSATSRQTWAATAYLRMVLMGLVGMRLEPAGVRFEPCVPEKFTKIELGNLHYRDMTLEVTVRGHGTTVGSFTVNGDAAAKPFLPVDGAGRNRIVIDLRPD